ncbi:hypothetical protein C8R47DRAFT_303471 [Mycena vitilis]|nr:hypothetical protein C8R47DRAFT_303471 [Mycena vitilis]
MHLHLPSLLASYRYPPHINGTCPEMMLHRRARFIGIAATSSTSHHHRCRSNRASASILPISLSVGAFPHAAHQRSRKSASLSSAVLVLGHSFSFKPSKARKQFVTPLEDGGKRIHSSSFANRGRRRNNNPPQPQQKIEVQGSLDMSSNSKLAETTPFFVDR